MKSQASHSRSAGAARKFINENKSVGCLEANARLQQPEGASDVITPGTNQSFDEEQFMSPSSFLVGSSWESQSFDGDERGAINRPDSTSSTRDRRKRFDTTTPTLVDEDDLPDVFDAASEGNIVELPSARIALEFSRDDSLIESIDAISLRRTPGASEMHQSATGSHVRQEASGNGNDEQTDSQMLAFAHLQNQQERDMGKWNSMQRSTTEVTSGVPGSNNNDCSSDAPRVPRTSSRSEAREPFSFGPWTKSTGGSTDQRHGAFSPNILRLTEDIGNLLQEDEDDDYAIEIPSVFRGGGQDGQATTGVGADWTGAYAFDNKFYNKGAGEGMGHHRSSNIMKVRRRSNNYQSGAGGNFGATAGNASSFFPIAIQPKPQHIRNEIFEFGKNGDDRSSPQLFSTSGAFVPPSKEPSGSFSRPVASAPASSYVPPFQHAVTPQNTQAEGSESVMFGRPTLAFQSYQSATHGGPGTGPFVVQGTHFGPSASEVPASSTPTPQFRYRGQEMQATAQEFVPMSTRNSGYLGPQHHWQTPLPSALAFEARMMEGSWVPVPSHPPSYQQNSVYNIPPATYEKDSSVRATTTPSPHLGAWQHQQPPPHGDAGPFRVQSSTPVDAIASPVMLPVSNPVPQARTSEPSPDTVQVSRAKKVTNRNARRTKKKTKPEKSFSVGVKKKGKEGLRPNSSFGGEAATDETAASVTEDPIDSKKAELDESPATRIAFKEFYRAFRFEERHSFQKAEELAYLALEDGSLPASIHWRVYLELADLARRSNRYTESRRLYQKVCQLQPFASQGWLEYSKLEEDCGFMNRVSNILHAGLEYCEHSETLLTRAVKHQERTGNPSSARAILARLKHVGIDKVWRTVLEGALLEARAGNHDMARRVLKYLMFHVPWYGPLYLEAYKLERDQGHPMDAMSIVERGLTTLPRYGPLWFGAFRLYEEIDVTEKQFHLPRTMMMIERAKSTISKELVWKLHLEAAQMLERTALAYVEDSGLDLLQYLAPVRRRLVLTILTCPQNLRWKVWLAAGRMALVVGDHREAHSLFQRAHFCVQQKSKSATLLDCSRLAEFTGDIQLARGILTKARSFYCSDWKVWFESVLVELRNNNHSRGYEIAARGLELHTGSGRLWATLVQLGQLVGGDEMQTKALERALRAVPKSGEVWCEGARIHLNPFSCTFDLHRSRRYLHFAARFTPQFGDSFIESIRLEVLSQWLYPIAKFIWKRTRGSFNDDEAANRSIREYVMNVYMAVAVARRESGRSEVNDMPESKFREIVGALRKKLRADNLRSSIDLTDLRLACANADPNYGSLWFHCRRLPMFTPRRVIEHAAEDIADEIFKYANIYLAAMIRRIAVLERLDREMPESAERSTETSDPDVISWEDYIDAELRRAVSLQEILDSEKSRAGLALLESATHGSIFITGLSELNRYRPLESMTLLERRRALFGTDALFP